MNRKITKIIIIVVLLVAIAGVGIGLYFNFNHGSIVGRIEFDRKYYLTEIRPTERFAGATINSESYLKINTDKKSGELYLVGLTATDGKAIPLIVTSYKEGVKQTVIEFEYILNNGDDTEIQRLKAISTNEEIRIKAVESHSVKIIKQNPDKVDTLDYSVTILVFKKVEAK